MLPPQDITEEYINSKLMDEGNGNNLKVSIQKKETIQDNQDKQEAHNKMGDLNPSRSQSTLI